ncbi:MAG: hypothetical protein R3E42_00355 [Burkholderiaceae bacterium]
MVAQVLRQERLETQHAIEEVVALSRLWMRGELQAVERALPQVSNLFLRTGVQMIIDRTPEDEIIDLLQWRIAHLRSWRWPRPPSFAAWPPTRPPLAWWAHCLGLINLMDLVAKAT